MCSGLSNTTACTTINKVCASGMKSIMLGASSLALGLKVPKYFYFRQLEITTMIRDANFRNQFLSNCLDYRDWKIML